MKSLSSLRISFICFGFFIGLIAGSHRSANADIAYSKTTNLGTNINTSYNDGTPCISHNGLSLYFGSERPGGVGMHDLWVATRASILDEWSEPVHLGTAVNNWAQDYGPSISSDGLTLYFRSNRTGGLGQGDIWVSTRSSRDATWPAAVNAGSGINTASDECMPCISSDSLELYFGSTRSGGQGQDDLYVVTRPTTDSAWSDPVNLGPTVNSEAVDASPSISPDGLMLFFNSTRSSGFGNYDLYMTTRPSTEAPWSTAVNLGSIINTADDEMTPSFWADGSAIYFCSWADRPGTLGGADLWHAVINPVVDLNGDGIVDSSDICIMVNHWGDNYSLCDIGPMPWGDGIVDIEDMKILAEHLFEEVEDHTLVAHWALDEAEGIIAADIVSEDGYSDGIVIGDPVWLPTSGQVDGAIQLDGVDDCITTSPVLNPADGPFSILAWIKGGVPGQIIVSQQGVANWLALDTKGNLMMELKCTGRSTGPLFSEAIITDEQWHRIGLVWDGSYRTLYVDGVAVVDDTQRSLASSNGGLYIGCGKSMESDTFFSGLLDDIRIYNRAVSP